MGSECCANRRYEQDELLTESQKKIKDKEILKEQENDKEFLLKSQEEFLSGFEDNDKNYNIKTIIIQATEETIQQVLADEHLKEYLSRFNLDISNLNQSNGLYQNAADYQLNYHQ